MNIRQQEILEKNLAENSGQNTEIEQYIERSDLSDILEDEIFENFSFCESKAGKSSQFQPISILRSNNQERSPQ